MVTTSIDICVVYSDLGQHLTSSLLSIVGGKKRHLEFLKQWLCLQFAGFVLTLKKIRYLMYCLFKHLKN